MFGGAGLRLPGSREHGAAFEQAVQTARTQVKCELAAAGTLTLG